jgi:hypothetical protein
LFHSPDVVQFLELPGAQDGSEETGIDWNIHIDGFFVVRMVSDEFY